MQVRRMLTASSLSVMSTSAFLADVAGDGDEALLTSLLLDVVVRREKRDEVAICQLL